MVNTGKGWGKPSKGAQKGKKGPGRSRSERQGQRAQGDRGRDRPAGEPDQQIQAKAKKRPNKKKRRGGRSDKALLRRSHQGFSEAAEELVTRTAQAKPKPKKRYRLRITPKIERLREEWPRLSFSERTARKTELRKSGLIPPGSVGEHIVREFAEACDTCDERTKKQREPTLLAASRAVKRQIRALRLRKEEKKEKKNRRKKRQPLLTEDEADDEGQGDEESDPDGDHRSLGGRHGGFDPGAPGTVAAVR